MSVMTQLTPPSRSRYAEWLALVADFGEDQMMGSGFSGEHQPVLTPDGFADWITFLETEADENLPAFEGRVKSSYFWILDDSGAWVGHLSIRRTLNDFLRELGGHIGYSVRPSRRREGHASAALTLALTEARALGLDQVLVTCDEDNLGSRRTIESCGGVYEDSRQGRRRYWLPT